MPSEAMSEPATLVCCKICGAYLQNGQCPYPTNSTHEIHSLKTELAALRAQLEGAERHNKANAKMIVESGASVEEFPVWEFVEDEMKARGMTREDLAAAMGGDVMHNLCALDFLEAAGTASRITLGSETAKALSTAFGTSAEIWMYLDASYHRSLAWKIERELAALSGAGESK